MTIKITRESGKVWQWQVIHGAEVLGASYCATKRDALNDAQIFMEGRITSLINTLKAAHAELGKHSAWRISTLREDIGQTLVNAGVLKSPLECKAKYHVRQGFVAQVVKGGVRVVFDESATHAFGEFIDEQDFIGDGCQIVEYSPTDFNDPSPYNARRMTEEISQEVQS